MQGKIETDGDNKTLVLNAETFGDVLRFAEWTQQAGNGMEIEDDGKEVRLRIPLRQRSPRQPSKAKGKPEPEAAPSDQDIADLRMRKAEEANAEEAKP